VNIPLTNDYGPGFPQLVADLAVFELIEGMHVGSKAIPRPEDRRPVGPAPVAGQLLHLVVHEEGLGHRNRSRRFISNQQTMLGFDMIQKF
jgi:hypothetical protein